MEAEKRGKKMMMVRLSLQCKYNISNMINLMDKVTEDKPPLPNTHYIVPVQYIITSMFIG